MLVTKSLLFMILVTYWDDENSGDHMIKSVTSIASLFVTWFVPNIQSLRSQSSCPIILWSLPYNDLCDVISHILRIWKIFWFLTIVFSCQQSFWCLFWRTLPLIWAAQKYGPYIPNYIKSAYNKTPPCCRWNHRSFHSQSNNKYWRWLDCLTQQKGTEPARRITRNTFKRI